MKYNYGLWLNLEKERIPKKLMGILNEYNPSNFSLIREMPNGLEGYSLNVKLNLKNINSDSPEVLDLVSRCGMIDEVINLSGCNYPQKPLSDQLTELYDIARLSCIVWPLCFGADIVSQIGDFFKGNKKE